MEEDRDKSPEDSIPLADDDPQGMFFCTVDLLIVTFSISHCPLVFASFIIYFIDNKLLSQPLSMMIKTYLNVPMLLYAIKVWIHYSRRLQMVVIVQAETVSVLYAL